MHTWLRGFTNQDQDNMKFYIYRHHSYPLCRHNIVLAPILLLFFFFFYHNQPLAQRTSSCECTPQTNKQTNTSNSNFQHHCHGLGKLVDGGKSPRLAALMILLITASYYSIKLSVCGSSTGSDTYTC